ncbi:putative nuclear hormone receptor HR3 [Aphelenchoides bicaudatus]|nr:putative nuclear hormone receptor HR3 [Aphelenchoides bicaudatus]
MSREAVKFGRMSKKQRECVEDEVRLHRQRAEFQHQQGYPVYDYNKYAPPASASHMLYSNGTNTPLGSNYEMYQQQHPSPLNTYPPCTSALHNGNLISQPLATSVAPISYVPQPSPALAAAAPYRYATSNSMPNYQMAPQIGQVASVNGAYSSEYDITQDITSTFDESLIKSIVNAYESAHQIYLTGEPDEPNLSMSKKQEPYLGMDRTSGWIKFANELTKVVKFIIEFAKSIPNFSTVEQSQQITLLKQSAFELAIIGISQHYNMANETLTVDDVALPIKCFSCADLEDMEFGRELIQCIHLLASFHLNNTEIALLSAIVLMNSSETQKDFVLKTQQCLYTEFSARFEESPQALLNRLLSLVGRLNELSRRHILCLNRFQSGGHHQVDLPPLYKELFSYDGA